MTAPVVLVTGASSGIGLALAEHYAHRGAQVALLARRLDRLQAVASRLGPGARAIRCDVSADGDIERAVDETLGAFGRIDIVIANAGIGVLGTVDRTSLDSFRRVFETNVFGVLRTAKAALGPLRAARGRLAILGSVNGYLALPGSASYVASKFAVRGLAESLAHELAPDGVSVTHVAPGFVESEIRLLDREGRLSEGAKDPVPRWLVMPTAVAAKQMARAIDRRKREAIITAHGKVVVFFERHAHGLLRAVVGLGTRRGRRMS